MALINCPECGHRTSDKEGSICPGCGAPASAARSIKGYQMLGLAIAAVGVITFFVAPHPYGPFLGGVMLVFGLIGTLL